MKLLAEFSHLLRFMSSITVVVFLGIFIYTVFSFFGYGIYPGSGSHLTAYVFVELISQSTQTPVCCLGGEMSNLT